MAGGPQPAAAGYQPPARGCSVALRIMALDLGNRRIGVAVCDPDETLAQGITVIERRSRKLDLETLSSLARELAVGEMVVGYPLLLSGQPGEQARAAKRVGKAVGRSVGLPVVYWDERLTTAAARRLMREAGIPGHRQGERVDAAAAELILQNYLDWRRRESQ